MPHPLSQPDATWPCDHCGAVIPPKRGKRHAHRFDFLCTACQERSYLVHYSARDNGWYVLNTRARTKDGPFYADRTEALRSANYREGYPDSGRRYVVQQIPRRGWCVVDSTIGCLAEEPSFKHGGTREPYYARREQALAVANTYEQARDHAAEALDRDIRALAWYPSEQRSQLIKLRQRVRGTPQQEDLW